MLTLEQLKAVFTEWDRRAAEGSWEGNPSDPEASADIFTEIAVALFPELHPAQVKLADLKAGDTIEIDGGFNCAAAGPVGVHIGDDGELYFDCRAGRHYLAGQEDEPGEALVGVIGHRRGVAT